MQDLRSLIIVVMRLTQMIPLKVAIVDIIKHLSSEEVMPEAYSDVLTCLRYPAMSLLRADIML